MEVTITFKINNKVALKLALIIIAVIMYVVK